MEDRDNESNRDTERLLVEEESSETVFLDANAHSKETLASASEREPGESGSYRDLLRRLSQSSETVGQVSEEFTSVFNVRALVGKTLAKKYEILERIGRGGMGTVFRARDVTLDRFVAVKVLNPSLSDDEHSLNRFLREAKLISRLKHQNAISLYEFGLEGAIPYLVMEYVEGQSLERIIADEGPFDIIRANLILQQVCAALQSAHALGILHRDLKPDNIMVTRQPDGFEFVQVLDFGMAKALGTENERGPKISSTGVPCGTPHYMAPELITAQDVDLRADIYALGIIAYQMLVGKTPFEDLSTVEILYHQFHTIPPLVTEANPSARISRGVEKAVAKALEKDPNERFQSVEELAATFNEHVQDDFMFVSGSQSARVIEPYRSPAYRSKRARLIRNPLIRFWVAWFLITSVSITVIWSTIKVRYHIEVYATKHLIHIEDSMGYRLEGWRRLAGMEVYGTVEEAFKAAFDNGYRKSLAIYIAANRNLDVRDEAGNSLLHMAVSNGNAEGARWLLEANINPTARNKVGITPLMIAAQSGSAGIAHMLLEHRSAVDAKDDKGQTALMIASSRGSLSLLHTLLIHKAGINLSDESGRTALMYAVERRHREAAEFLLDRGAALEQKDTLGRTALSIAAGAGSEELVQMLIQRGAEVDTLAQGDLTPLMVAVSMGEVQIARLLLDRGASPKRKSSLGVSAEDMARLQGEQTYQAIFGDRQGVS